MRQITQWSPVRYDLIQLMGGLDQVTPQLSLKPGIARDSLNWEQCIYGGYTRIPGYERVDGRPSPSSAGYTIVPLTISGLIVAGQTLVGLTSGAAGVVIYVGSNYVAVSQDTGTYELGESVQISAVTVGTVTDTSSYMATSLLNATLLAAAADAYRADIQVVPGSGAVRGVMYLSGVVYAFRNNAGGTACELFKTTSAGWEQVALGDELAFSAGNAAIADGATITNGAGATATVARAVVESGSYSGGTAAGRLILSATTGTWAASDPIKVGITTVATAGGAATAITLLPNGRIESKIGQFGGVKRLYGCDGVNRGFEFDGATYVPIRTGMPLDAPNHLEIHKNHLFFAFGSSVQHSGIGTPYIWSPIFGASELLASDRVTDFVILPGSQQGGALGIYCSTNIDILYGSSTADWNLVTFNTGVGAYDYSAQNLVDVFALDDRGVMSMTSSLNYGNFDIGSLTANIRPFIVDHRGRTCASSLNREKSQYRVFFNDGYGLYMTIINNKLMGSMPVAFPDPVLCTCQGEDDDGNEVSFFGTSSGYVHQFDRGTSFDGQQISSYFTLVYNFMKSPRIIKRFRKASLEVTSSFYTTFDFGYSLAYSSTDVMQPGAVSYETAFSSPYWDQFTWDEFIWDGLTLSPSECEVEGDGENIAITVSSESAILNEFTINSMILHYSLRRGLR